jgi:hypothetical protein
MTDEERRELCADLMASWFEEAADEIERLAEDKRQALNVCQRLLAQSDAEPGTYPGGRTKAEWDVIARASYERAKDLPDD